MMPVATGIAGRNCVSACEQPCAAPATEAACGNHFLYQESADSNVVADIEGAGILYFWRANFWHGSPWLYEIDGETHRVEETATACRTEAHSYRWEEEIPPHHFIPEKQFPEPLALTWVQNHGSDLSWVPIPFENSFRMAYSKTSCGTGYGIFHTFLPGIPLSQPLTEYHPEHPYTVSLYD